MTTGPVVPSSAYFAWATVCVVWGTTYLAIRIALETIPPALVGGIRYAIGGALVVAVILVRGRMLPAPSQWPGLMLLGFLMFCLGNGGVIWAEQWVPTGVAAVVVASTPFWMTGIEALLSDGEPLAPRTMVGLGLGFVGIVLLVWPDLAAAGAGGRDFAVGFVALQVACAGWALGSSYGRRHARSDDTFASAGLQMLFGGAWLLVIATARGEWAQLSYAPRALAAEIYLTLVGSIIGYTAYLHALKHLPMSTVALYAYINPVIAVALGSLLLDEPLSVRLVIAFALVMTGVAIVSRRRTRARDQHR